MTLDRVSPIRYRRTMRATAVVSVAVLALFAASCTKSSGSSTTTSTGSGGGGGQQVQSSSSGPQCTATKYGAPKLTLKNTTVGFSQSESTSNPFRATESKSITGEAKSLGLKLIQRNADGDVNMQNSQIEDMIAQGAKVLIVAPENSDGLKPALAQAKAKKIPVLTIDRTVSGKACSDFIAFIGSDFAGQAKIAADDLIQATGGKGNIAMLLGTSGNNVTNARTSGFVKEIAAKAPNMKIVAKQTANFDQTTGQKVMENVLQGNSSIAAVYAENDEMAFGAIQAIRSAGKTPGKDIKIVSIDGTQQAVQDVASGLLFSDVETNPRFGPLGFQSLMDFYSGKGVSATVIIKDHHYTSANAKSSLSSGQVY